MRLRALRELWRGIRQIRAEHRAELARFLAVEQARLRVQEANLAHWEAETDRLSVEMRTIAGRLDDLWRGLEATRPEANQQ